MQDSYTYTHTTSSDFVIIPLSLLNISYLTETGNQFSFGKENTHSIFLVWESWTKISQHFSPSLMNIIIPLCSQTFRKLKGNQVFDYCIFNDYSTSLLNIIRLIQTTIRILTRNTCTRAESSQKQHVCWIAQSLKDRTFRLLVYFSCCKFQKSKTICTL